MKKQMRLRFLTAASSPAKKPLAIINHLGQLYFSVNTTQQLFDDSPNGLFLIGTDRDEGPLYSLYLVPVDESHPNAFALHRRIRTAAFSLDGIFKASGMPYETVQYCYEVDRAAVHGRMGYRLTLVEQYPRTRRNAGNPDAPSEQPFPEEHSPAFSE